MKEITVQQLSRFNQLLKSEIPDCYELSDVSVTKVDKDMWQADVIMDTLCGGELRLSVPLTIYPITLQHCSMVICFRDEYEFKKVLRDSENIVKKINSLWNEL